MGTWGTGNLDSDSACDRLFEFCEELVGQTLDLARSPEAAEYDEYAHTKLFVNLEIIFGLSRSRMLRFHPEPDELREIKAAYIARWHAYARKNNAEWPERAEAIEKTFDHFIGICDRESLRPAFVLVAQPDTPFPLDVKLEPHLIFGRYGLSLPDSWNSRVDALPSDALLRMVFPDSSTELDCGDFRVRLKRAFFACGELSALTGIVRPAAPYLCLGELEITSGSLPSNLYPFERTVEKALSPSFATKDRWLDPGFALDDLKNFDFAGLEAWHRLDSEAVKAPFYAQSLYCMPVAENCILVLEFGSHRAGVLGGRPADEMLVHSLYQSLTAAN